MGNVRISFVVSEEVAEKMTHSSVYLDVFGQVRWSHEPNEIVGNMTRWKAEPLADLIPERLDAAAEKKIHRELDQMMEGLHTVYDVAKALPKPYHGFAPMVSGYLHDFAALAFGIKKTLAMRLDSTKGTP